MKVLLLGGTGMAGHLVALFLKEKGHEVVCVVRRKIEYCNFILLDVRNIDQLEKKILTSNFDVIINCIGILNKDAENNKSDAVFINGYLPHFLSKITNNIKTRIIHISTDCVFSGKNGNYTESSYPDGQSFYDRTKAIGEIVNKKDLTFRTSIIGPDINQAGIGLFNWFMMQEKRINGYTDAIWTGVTTLTLAQAIDAAMLNELTGLYHLVNNRMISKYNLLCLFNKYFRNNELQINPYHGFACNKSLINNRTDFKFIIGDYEDMVVELKTWIGSKFQMYKHYVIKGER